MNSNEREVMPWYRRVQLELRLVYQALPGPLPVGEWAFNLHRIWTAQDKAGRPCWWAAGAVRVLGLDVGAGVFIFRARHTELPTKG